jgi:hypothetical protein
MTKNKIEITMDFLSTKLFRTNEEGEFRMKFKNIVMMVLMAVLGLPSIYAQETKTAPAAANNSGGGGGASVIVAEPDGEVEDPPDPERGDGESERDYLIRTMEDRGVSDVEIPDVLDRYDYANPVSVEEDDGDPE